MRKGNLVKHNVTGAAATVESVNSLTGTFTVYWVVTSSSVGTTAGATLLVVNRQADFTVVPRKAGRPKATKPSASAFLKQINALAVPVPTTEREAAINGVIGLINLVAAKGVQL